MTGLFTRPTAESLVISSHWPGVAGLEEGGPESMRNAWNVKCSLVPLGCR